MKMYSRNGGIEVSDLDATTTVRKFPHDWTLRPWLRPDGRPDVLIPDDWNQKGILERIDLARSTFADAGHGIETVAQADQAIYEYLAGTRYPESAS